LSKLTQEIEKHIKKMVNPLLAEDTLLPILKVKLTKKELKLLNYWSQEKTIDEICTKLNLDEKHYGELSTKLIKKLNQEKIKQVICL